MADTYKIVRHYFKNDRTYIIARGLTLEEAQEHCSDPETSSNTCSSRDGQLRTARNGPWFDGYEVE